MNYIGSKLSLLTWLDKSVRKVTGNHFETFFDLFSGTGAVGTYYKKKGFQVSANDIQYYSYALARHYIGNSTSLKFEGLRPVIFPGKSKSAPAQVVKYLNQLPGMEGFIYKNYCPGGTRGQVYERQYFSDANGQRCDHIRQTIEKWKTEQLISEDEYFWLLACLLESIDKYANTASVYGAYLKRLKKSAQRTMELTPLPIIKSPHHNMVYNQNINELIGTISGDVLYLDPPYNQRQYATNYHLLETIARYDNPEIHGLTGLREYSAEKSVYCSKARVLAEFEDLIMRAKFKYIFLSYNNEGLMSLEDVKRVMSKRGKYGLFTTRYNRFKADTDANRVHKSDHTFEFLHYVIVDK